MCKAGEVKPEEKVQPEEAKVKPDESQGWHDDACS